MNGAPEIFTAAQHYAMREWNVVPVAADKSPLTKNGFYDASADHSAVTDLWKRAPNVNGVGIRTGVESGLVVLDIDLGHDGEKSLAVLVATHGELPVTVEARTGGGGRHVYFRHPGGRVPCSVGKLGDGLDLRGDGGYVVAPPSRHLSGEHYRWLRAPDDFELAAAPDWLLAPPQTKHESRPAPTSKAAIPEGRRNATLASFAGQLRRIDASQEEIEAALQVRNDDRCEPSLRREEVAAVAASIARYEPEPAGEPATARALKVQSAKEIVESPDPPGDANLLGPLLVRGARTVIGAHTGEGKTTLAFQMIHAVTTRSGFLDHTGAGGKVLIIDAEQGLLTIKRRLREAGLTESTQVDYLRVPDGLALDQDGGSDVVQLEAILEEGRYDLVLLDPLYKLHRGDSNEERHAVDLMRRLDAWRERFGFAVILLVHRRKSQIGNRGFSMDDLYGSGAYLRGAEVVLGLRRTAPGHASLHIFKDRDGDLPVGEKWGLLFDREEGFRRDPEADKEKETSHDKVRAALEETPDGLTTKQLERLSGYSDKTVRKAVQELDAESTTGPSGVKVWSLPDGENVGGG